MVDDDRSPLAHAIGTAYAVIGVCLQMVAPILLGYWLDQRLNTHGLFIIAGVIIGVLMGGIGLFYLLKSSQLSKPDQEKDEKGPR